ncbi:MAG: penicillin acylase family protein [Thermodesulfobacteriota bacterium]
MIRSKILWIITALVLIVCAAALIGLPRLNGFQADGTLILPGLSGPVKVMRDEKGMAYIHAQSFHDAIIAQGFVTAQDRLFQMQVTRLLAQGRIAELVGDRGKSTDLMMRTIGIHRNAKKHAAILDDSTRTLFQNYVDGVNAWIRLRPKDLHIEFKLAGIQPEPWTIEDCLSIAYYMGWTTSANVQTEIMAQLLVDKVGLDRAQEIFPLNINPDDPSAAEPAGQAGATHRRVNSAGSALLNNSDNRERSQQSRKAGGLHHKNSADGHSRLVFPTFSEGSSGDNPSSKPPWPHAATSKHESQCPASRELGEGSEPVNISNVFGRGSGGQPFFERVSPGRPSGKGFPPDHFPRDRSDQLHVASDQALRQLLRAFGDGRGSNNWAVNPRLSPNGKPVVASDPHLDARMLPGVWYPCGMVTPEFRAVGANIPGVPGMVIGRTDRVAMGVTNAYGDCQDLYVETVDPRDPGKYLEGDASRPFEVITERFRIKDKSAPEGYRHETSQIRLTRRGPVVSGILPGVGSDKVITLRWAAAETMQPSLGLDKVLISRSARELRAGLRHLNFIVLNWVFADVEGSIGWHVSGRLPVRSQGESTLPFVVKDAKDNWIGWIGFNQMPHSEDPATGWVGTCNHKTVKTDYPHYYSSYFASADRYRRLKELLDEPRPWSVDEHWGFQRDTSNVLARSVVPILVRALDSHGQTRPAARMLETWDGRDDPDKAAPTLFHLTWANLFRLTFRDELGDELTDVFINKGYFWKERFRRMVREGSSVWFDDVRTPDKRETRDDLIRQAALAAIETLKVRQGDDSGQWLWGKLHQIEFVNPIRRTGFGKSLLGGGLHPMGGSRDTLYCAWNDYNKPFEVILSASLRMVADLGDKDKILAVLPGGVCGRTFSPHQKDQVEPYMRGDKVYWWFSDEAIRDHTRSTLVLNPN